MTERLTQHERMEKIFTMTTCLKATIDKSKRVNVSKRKTIPIDERFPNPNGEKSSRPVYREEQKEYDIEDSQVVSLLTTSST